MLDLYHNGSSVCAAKVRILLAAKNRPWTGHYLDVLAGDQFDPDYLKLNPNAVVPTLVEDFFVDRFVSLWGSNVPERLVLDVDASDILLHGGQQGRFYHGYYGGYCYLPLYIVCGQHVLMAKLRRANRDGAIGTADALGWIVASLRRAWPDVEICVRGDSGFARDELLVWCEDNDVDYTVDNDKTAGSPATDDSPSRSTASWARPGSRCSAAATPSVALRTSSGARRHRGAAPGVSWRRPRRFPHVRAATAKPIRDSS